MAVAPSTTDRVERELRIAAPRETVWAFLTEPAKMTQWMGMHAACDVRPGGAYRVEIIPGNVAVGEFVTVEPPSRIVYTWGWESGDKLPPGATTVEIELVEQGGGTIVRFSHSGLPSPESAASHAHGWDHYLPRLELAAAGGEPGDDPWITARPAM